MLPPTTAARASRPVLEGLEPRLLLSSDVVTAEVLGVDTQGYPNRPLEELSVRFDGDVEASLAADALSLHDDTAGRDVDPAALTFSYEPSTNTATWRFDGVPGGAICGARFSARLGADGVVDAGGRPLDGDGDGNAGGDLTFSFVVTVPGDFNLDGWVDEGDRAALAHGFGLAGGAAPADGDADGDGDVDATDYLAWKAGTGTKVVANRMPGFATPLADRYVIVPGGDGLTLGIDGCDPDGETLTVSAVSDSPDLAFTVPQGNRCARLHFVESDGVTPMGDILVQLFEGRSAPATERFITLATQHVNADGTLDPDGVPFYTNVPVHRVIDEFMVQTGDAVNGDGTGGSPLGDYADAFDPALSFTGRGALACANSGADTNDSQFFLTEVATTWLNQHHMIFGQIVSGWDVLETLSELETDGSDRPLDVPLLAYVEIVDCPQAATVTVIAGPDFTGDAEVTVRVDDGNGNVAEQTITVSAQLTIEAPDEIIAPPGETVTFTPTIVHTAGGPLNVSVQTDASDLAGNVRIDSETYEVTVDVPVGIDTAHNQIQVSAVEIGYDNAWTVRQVVDVLVAGADPAISPIDDIHLTSGEAFSFTPSIQDDTPRALAVSIASIPEALGATIDPDTHEVELTAPAAGAGLVAVTISAVESGFTDRAPVTRTFYVSYHGTGDAVPLGRAGTNLAGAAQAGVRLDDRLYVASGVAGLEVFDVADPAVPSFLGAYLTTDDARDVVIARQDLDGQPATIAYVAATYGGVAVLDVSDPSQITGLVTLDVGNAALSLALEDNVLYVAHWTTGISAFDVSDPRDIHLLGTAHQFPADEFNISYAVDVVPNGDTVYVVDAAGGYAVLDASDPEDMALVLTRGTGQSPWNAVVQGERLYVLAQTNGVIVYDVAQADSPQLLGYLPLTLDQWTAFDVRGGLAVVSAPTGCAFVDVSDPQNMTVLQTFTTPATPWRPTLTATELALPLGVHGVLLLDVSALLGG